MAAVLGISGFQAAGQTPPPEAKPDNRAGSQNPTQPKPDSTKSRSKTQGSAKSQVRRDRPGFYMGRRIADVMSWEGVDWLFRETRINEEEPEAMLDALAIPPGATVADVGAGAGYHSIRMARRVGSTGTVLASDIQPEMLRMLETNARSVGVTNIKPIRATQSDPKLPAGSVDLILMVDVYHECSNPDVTLQGLLKALKPRGQASAGRIPWRGRRGPHQARAQDDPQTGSARDRATRLRLQGISRIPSLAAYHHLRETGER